jgi:hypothetical protein
MREQCVSRRPFCTTVQAVRQDVGRRNEQGILSDFAFKPLRRVSQPILTTPPFEEEEDRQGNVREAQNLRHVLNGNSGACAEIRTGRARRFLAIGLGGRVRNSHMGVNFEKAAVKKADIARSVDVYNDWSMRFARKAEVRA